MLYKKNLPFIILILTVLFFSSCGSEKIKPNILLITIDTLRRDHLGVYGYPRNTSPFIDRLARAGVMFKYAVTPIPSTTGSHASILTSLHPLTHNAIALGSHLHEKVETMAEVLKKNGYYTIGTVAVKLLSGKRKFSQGFDSFSDEWDNTAKHDTKYERTAASVNQSLYAQIDQYISNHKEKPLFIWVHYFDPHTPYHDKKHITFKNKRPERENNRGIKWYDKEIRHTDSHIERLYKYLSETGIAGRLVTCVTADHGEQFYEHGYTFCHADFYSETTLVPLIFHGRGIPENKTVNNYVSTMDIAVTLLGLANLTFDSPTGGINLMDLYIKNDYTGERKFLIIGNPNYERSLQLLGNPFDYILNFDYHYEYWFISGQDIIPGNRFKPIPKARVKTKNNVMRIKVPKSLRRGRNFVIVRVDIKKNEGLAVDIKMTPYSFTNKIRDLEEIEHLNIIYPVTIMDSIIVNLELNNGTIVDNVRYTYISKQEFPGDSTVRKIKNKIYEKLLTRRKDKRKNELFDLSSDIKMERNLVGSKRLKPIIQEYGKLIYSAFKYYYEKKNRLLKGSKSKKNLTKEDKEMLKSLGYL